jgi:hypothetical protein
MEFNSGFKGLILKDLEIKSKFKLLQPPIQYHHHLAPMEVSGRKFPFNTGNL